MSSLGERKITWYQPYQGDGLGGTAAQFSVPCVVRVRVHSVTVSSVIIGPHCVQLGSVYTAGPDLGDVLNDNGPGQVNC